MNPLQSLILRITIITYLIAPISCTDSKFNCSDSCCGETYEQEYTEIDSLTLTVGSIEMFEGNGYQINDFSNDKSTVHNEAAISINIHELTWLASVLINPKSRFRFSLVNQAYACSTPEPEPTQKIASISISSDQSITVNEVTYQNGEDLSNFFSIVNRYQEGGDETIEKFIFKQNEDPYLFGSYGSSILFRLNTAIDLPNQVLTFKINFEDETSFTLTTNEFVIE